MTLTLAGPPLATLDVLAAGQPGCWEHDEVLVVRRPGAQLRLTRSSQVLVEHGLAPHALDESLVARVGGLVQNAREFELVLTGIVRSTVDDPLQAWTTYYRHSLRALDEGSAAFAPVHAHAHELVAGTRVLDLGSCFGFFPLRLARAGLEVTASDVCAGTMRLLAEVSTALGTPVRTLTSDAAAVDRADGCADTVTALHLLEHLEPAHGAQVLAEAVRLARRRVVVAVPFEDTATACYGHVRTFTPDSLRALGAGTVHEHHGGWLVLDVG